MAAPQYCILVNQALRGLIELLERIFDELAVFLIDPGESGICRFSQRLHSFLCLMLVMISRNILNAYKIILKRHDPSITGLFDLGRAALLPVLRVLPLRELLEVERRLLCLIQTHIR